MESQDNELYKQFFQVYVQHQRQILGFLLAAVKDSYAAEDLLQEVALALWNNFDRYDSSRPFLPWAIGVARNHMRTYFRTLSRRPKFLSLDVAENLALAMKEEEESLIAERAALHECLQGLSSRHRDMLFWRYEQRMPLKAIAEKLGRSLSAANMALCRIRERLLACAERAVSREEMSS